MLVFTSEAWGELVLPFLLRALVAAFCGAFIGLERELRGKAAGFRTNMLICVGAAVFMVISELVAEGAAPGRMSDPGRIAAQVVSGIGFLGAGAIIQSGGAVRGLTSAAMIWVVAAVGLAAGAGYLEVAILATVLTLAITSLLGLVERRFLGGCELVTCRLVLSSLDETARKRLEEVLREHDVRLEGVTLSREAQISVVVFEYCRRHAYHREVIGEIWGLPGILEVRNL